MHIYLDGLGDDELNGNPTIAIQETDAAGYEVRLAGQERYLQGLLTLRL